MAVRRGGGIAFARYRSKKERAMKRKSRSAFLFCVTAVSLLFFVSCSPVVVIVVTATPMPFTSTPVVLRLTDTPTAVPLTDAATLVPMTATSLCPPENWPCPNDSLTLTAAMATGLAATPSRTPPPWATIVPSVGDLGWGAVYGKIIDGNTLLPIEGATVRCEHFSYTSPYRCSGVATTNADGLYSFVPVFFHDTDRITLFVEAPGYMPLRYEQSFFTYPELRADLGLFPSAGATPSPTETAPAYTPPTPLVMCTAPACPNGSLVCGKPEGCPDVCGTICATATPTPFP